MKMGRRISMLGVAAAAVAVAVLAACASDDEAASPAAGGDAGADRAVAPDNDATKPQPTPDAAAPALGARWARVIGTTDGEAAVVTIRAVRALNDGGAIVAGTFDGTLKGPTALVSSGDAGASGFVLRIDPTGAIAWLVPLGSTTVDAIALDDDGNLIVSLTTPAIAKLDGKTAAPIWSTAIAHPTGAPGRITNVAARGGRIVGSGSLTSTLSIEKASGTLTLAATNERKDVLVTFDGATGKAIAGAVYGEQPPPPPVPGSPPPPPKPAIDFVVSCIGLDSDGSVLVGASPEQVSFAGPGFTFDRAKPLVFRATPDLTSGSVFYAFKTTAPRTYLAEDGCAIGADGRVAIGGVLAGSPEVAGTTLQGNGGPFGMELSRDGKVLSSLVATWPERGDYTAIGRTNRIALGPNEGELAIVGRNNGSFALAGQPLPDGIFIAWRRRKDEAPLVVAPKGQFANTLDQAVDISTAGLVVAGGIGQTLELGTTKLTNPASDGGYLAAGTFVASFAR